MSLSPLKVENTVRWRYAQDEDGNEIRESNARIVRWSDGRSALSSTKHVLVAGCVGVMCWEFVE